MTSASLPLLVFLTACSAPPGPAESTASADSNVRCELVSKALFVQVRVGNSQPLPFLFDTGVKDTLVDLDHARAASLVLGDELVVGGTGANTIKGYLLKDSPFQLVGATAPALPALLALPLDDLAAAMGHEIAGIVGRDFMQHFVVEIDYARQSIALHDKANYSYSGSGEVIPVQVDALGHTRLRAQVRLDDGSVHPGDFMVDTGSGASLILYTPFVDGERLLLPGQPTVPWLEGRGVGGRIDGVVGRVRAFELGKLTLPEPVIVFSRATAGAFAATDCQGNLGAAVLEKFKVILDYERGRMILEPNASFAEPMEYNRTGFQLTSSGKDYKALRIGGILENSPASEAGLRVGDVPTSLDGRPIGEFSLPEIRERLRKADQCELGIQRGPETLRIAVKFRRLI